MSDRFELYTLYKPCPKYNRLRHIKNEQLSDSLQRFSSDFRQFLRNPTTIFRRQQSPFEFVSNNFFKCLPKFVFGSKKNNRLFRKFVKKIVNCSYHECVFGRFVTKEFDLESVQWLHNRLTAPEKYQQLRNMIFYLGEKVKKMIRKFFFVTQSYSKLPHERLLIPHPQWNRFKDQIVNDLKKQQYMKNPVDINSRVCHGSLKILPKSDDLSKYRLVIRNNQVFKKSQNWRYFRKQIMEIIAKSFPDRVRTNELFKRWIEFAAVVKKQNLPVHGILIDLKDAFGNVNVHNLYENIKYYAIRNSVLPANRRIVLMKMLEKYLANGAPLIFVGGNRPESKNGSSKENRLFEWNHGLLQGDVLSSILCEFDRAQFEDTFLFDFKTPNIFIHRTVDDYFLCSTDLNIISKFHRIMTTECCVNREKIQSNRPEFTKSVSSEIVYNGIVFNLDNFETSSNLTFERKVSVKSKFKIWNSFQTYKNLKEFLDRAVNFQYNNFNFQTIFLNSRLNGAAKLIDNCFKAMSFVALKALDSLKSIGMALKKSFLSKFFLSCSKYYANKMTLIVRANCANTTISPDMYHAIALRVFEMVLKRWNKFPKAVLNAIRSKEKTIFYDKQYLESMKNASTRTKKIICNFII